MDTFGKKTIAGAKRKQKPLSRWLFWPKVNTRKGGVEVQKNRGYVVTNLLPVDVWWVCWLAALVAVECRERADWATKNTTVAQNPQIFVEGWAYSFACAKITAPWIWRFWSLPSGKLTWQWNISLIFNKKYIVKLGPFPASYVRKNLSVAPHLVGFCTSLPAP